MNKLQLPTKFEANLRQLSRYLRLPHLEAGFDMARYDDTPKRQLTHGGSRRTCGSVGCAVGHGPYAGLRKYSREEWVAYGDRVFGLTHKIELTRAWLWCFAPEWESYDNTPKGAAERIEYALDKGLPAGFVEPRSWWVPIYQGYISPGSNT